MVHGGGTYVFMKRKTSSRHKDKIQDSFQKTHIRGVIRVLGGVYSERLLIKSSSE